MRRYLSPVTAATALAAILLASAQTSRAPREKKWKQICSQVTAQPLPERSSARLESESWLSHCNAEELYYGFDRPADPVAALQCAYYERAHPQPERGDPFYGPGVLAMLYANGKGVPRDYDLAIRFACENSWAAEVEMELRVGHLEFLRDTHATTSDFDLCDDGTSGLTEGACESVVQGFADAKRQKELNAIGASWPSQVKQAFKALQEAENAFEDARTGNEVDLSGTGRAAFELEERGRLRDQFLINLRRFAKGDLPEASSVAGRAVDGKLDDVYQQIQQSPASDWRWGTIKPSGIRETERAWLKLCDAWVEFGRVAYPSLSADRIRTQLNRLRLHQLQSLIRKY